MSDSTFLFEGTDGAAATAGTTGLTTLYAPQGGGSAVYSAAEKVQGTTGLLLSNAAGAPAFIRTAADPASPLGADRIYYRMPNLLPASGTVYWLFNLFPEGSSSTRLLNLRWHPDGTLTVLDQSNAAASATTTPTWGKIKAAGSTSTDLVLSASTRYRFEVQYTVGTTASNGSWSVQIYPTTGTATEQNTPLNNTAHGSSTNTAANLGTVQASLSAWGLTGNQQATNFGLDVFTRRSASNSAVGAYSVPTITLFPAGPTVTTGWTKTGTGDVLADLDDGSYWETGDNPNGLVLEGVVAPIEKPVTGELLVLPLRSQAMTATTAKWSAKLYAPGSGGALLATSQDATITASMDEVQVTFTAASIAAITAAQFAGGMRCQLLATAS